MSNGIGPVVPVVPRPYQPAFTQYPAPKDDWGYYEGRPTPPKSPLMPFNTVPWFNRRWMFDKIVEPLYSTGGIERIGSLPTLRNRFVSSTPINRPSVVRDYHLISIRKQIEQLFAPLMTATIMLRVTDTMHIPPCHFLTHGRMQYSWWTDDGSLNGQILSPGHQHWMRDVGGNPSGSTRYEMYVTLDKNLGSVAGQETIDPVTGKARPTELRHWKGAVTGLRQGDDPRSSFGNYYIKSIKPRLYVTEYWRKMALERWSDVRADYESIASTFLQIVWGPWKDILQIGTIPTGRAKAFCLDQGQMWQPENFPSEMGGGKTYAPIPGSNNHHVVGKLINGEIVYAGPGYSACTRPFLEGQGFGGGSESIAARTSLDAIGFTGFKMIEGFNCGMYSGEIRQESPAETPNFPGRILRNTQLVYDPSNTANPAPTRNGTWEIAYTYTGVTTNLEQTTLELEIEPSEQRLEMSGYYYVAHCYGARVVPEYEVVIIDFNKREYTILVRDCEVYYQ